MMTYRQAGGQMDAAQRIQDDPRSPDWGSMRWSAWYPLDATGVGAGLVPPKQGIYRLQRVGHPELIYVGVSNRLRTRISNLRNGAGHSAAPCVAEHRCRGDVIEVSWTTTDAERRELLGLEVDLIAACRRLFGRSPACQFHGGPLE
jgi:hypothetical protein